MASKLLRSSPCTLAIKHKYGTVKPAVIPGTNLTSITSPDGIMVTKLPNNAMIVTAEPNLPVSTISFVYRSGSRFENADNAGAAHLIRLCAGLRTKNVTAFMHTRSIQQAGASLTTSCSREHTQYSLTGIVHENIETAWNPLFEIATEPLFREWEVEEVLPRVRLETENMTPSFQTMELLHKAAYHGTGLGRSLITPDHMLNKITSDELKEFHDSTHTTDRLAIVGLGCDHKWLAHVAMEMQETYAGQIVKSVYRGGLERRDGINRCAYVAIAGKGASIGTKDAVDLLVAEHILGSDANMKHGSQPGHKLNSAIVAACGSGEAYAINIKYSDCGLFGFFMVIEPRNVEKSVRELYAVFKNFEVTEVELHGAKQRAKARIWSTEDNHASQSDWTSKHVLATGLNNSPFDVCEAIDKVTVESVQAAVKKVMSSKLSMSAVGNIDEVPYLDDL